MVELFSTGGDRMDIMLTMLWFGEPYFGFTWRSVTFIYLLKTHVPKLLPRHVPGYADAHRQWMLYYLVSNLGSCPCLGRCFLRRMRKHLMAREIASSNIKCRSYRMVSVPSPRLHDTCVSVDRILCVDKFGKKLLPTSLSVAHNCTLNLPWGKCQARTAYDAVQ